MRVFVLLAGVVVTSEMPSISIMGAMSQGLLLKLDCTTPQRLTPWVPLRTRVVVCLHYCLRLLRPRLGCLEVLGMVFHQNYLHPVLNWTASVPIAMSGDVAYCLDGIADVLARLLPK